MHRCLICCALLLTGCTAPRIETRFVVPDVPADLRAPCVSKTRPYQSVADAALIITDLLQDRACANGKILATDEILTAAERRASGPSKQSAHPPPPGVP